MWKMCDIIVTEKISGDLTQINFKKIYVKNLKNKIGSEVILWNSKNMIIQKNL